MSRLSIVQCSSIGLELACLNRQVAVGAYDDGLFTFYPYSKAWNTFSSRLELDRVIQNALIGEEPVATLPVGGRVIDAVSYFAFRELAFLHDTRQYSDEDLADLLLKGASLFAQFGSLLQRFKRNGLPTHLPISDEYEIEQYMEVDCEKVEEIARMGVQRCRRALQL